MGPLCYQCEGSRRKLIYVTNISISMENPIFKISLFAQCFVCVFRMYVRVYLTIPCVSANDNIKHTKSNISMTMK